MDMAPFTLSLVSLFPSLAANFKSSLWFIVNIRSVLGHAIDRNLLPIFSPYFFHYLVVNVCDLAASVNVAAWVKAVPPC